MAAQQNNPFGLAFVIVCLAGTLVTGCRGLFLEPDQSPGWTLAKKLSGPAEATEWTLRQSKAGKVTLGVSAIRSYADPEQHPASSVDVRLAVIDGLGQVADKLTTDWPEGKEYCTLSLTPRLMFWHAARVAITLDDPVAAYGRVEPVAERPAIHSAWLEEAPPPSCPETKPDENIENEK